MATHPQTYTAEDNKAVGNHGPEVFDGFRFERLRRRLPGRESRHQAAATGMDQFNFSFGPDSCPGRFFGVYLIKCIVVEILLSWDVMLPGDDGTGQVERPKNIVRQVTIECDPKVGVCFRQRAQPCL